jgi:branched-chain amino acid transport system substrate-binding protein
MADQSVTAVQAAVADKGGPVEGGTMEKAILRHGSRTVAVALALVVGACAALDDESGPIRIGVLYPTTGVGQVSGAPNLLGHNMMVEKINAEGGLLGREVVSIHRDSRLDPGTATSLARELISRHRVHFLIGGLSSSEGQAVSEVARQEGVIYIATVPKTTELTQPENFHPYVFQTASNTDVEGKSGAIVVDRLGHDRVCTILYDYSYGHSLDAPFREHLQMLRPQAEIVYQAWPALGTLDYAPYITTIMNAGCTAVFSNIWSSNFPTFANQATTFGFFDRVQYVTGGDVGTPEIWEQMGDDMPEGIWTNAYEVFYHSEVPEHREYVAMLAERVGRSNTPSFPITGYVGMQFLAEAIREAGTTDTDAVIDALRGLEIMTPIGPQRIRPEDHMANRGEFWGPMTRSDDPEYPYVIMNPVEYIPADDLM